MDRADLEILRAPTKRRNLQIPTWAGFDNTNIHQIDEPQKKYKLQGAMELEGAGDKHVLFLSIQVSRIHGPQVIL